VLGVVAVGRLANAALINDSLINQANDGLVTLDTATNLRWLDLTLTTNLSVADILTGDPDGAGRWVTEGWRQATLSEMCGLFEPRTGEIFGCGHQQAPTSAVGVAELQSFVGVTLTEPHSDGTIALTQGFYAGGFGVLGLTTGNAVASVALIAKGGIPQGGESSPGAGHFLVRTPEPGVVSLFLLVLSRVWFVSGRPRVTAGTSSEKPRWFRRMGCLGGRGSVSGG
jgi:hypothetical protein